MDLVGIARRQRRELESLEFGDPVRFVYNPLEYAWEPHQRYSSSTWGRPGVTAVLLGMNPGPWGMAQTGVPFGEVDFAGNWLGLRAAVGRPQPEHPKRPVTGFDCPRSEVSGRRIWSWAKERFGAPESFFRHFFVLNYCPLCFLEESGRNRTPDKLPAVEKQPLEAICDRALRDAIAWLRPQWVIGVGRFAENRARRALDGFDLKIGTVLHPSPASPAANRGWQEQAERQLSEMLGDPFLSNAAD